MEKVIDVLNAAYNWAITRGELEFNPVAPIKSTTEKCYIVVRKKRVIEGKVQQIVELPEPIQMEDSLFLFENRLHE